jgi:ureidoacrylate peracid hydrolase
MHLLSSQRKLIEPRKTKTAKTLPGKAFMKTHTLSRRKVIGLIGGTAATTLVASHFEQPASAQVADALPQAIKSRTVQVDAKPETITIDITKTAVIVVDMQNDFGSKGGMFDRAGIDLSTIQRAIGPTARVLAAARKTGMRIIYLKMAFLPDLSDMGMVDSPNWRVHSHIMHVGTKVTAPNGAESRILIRDTWNTDIVNELKPEPTDTVIYKSRFSGFYQTDLDTRLKAFGIKYLIVTGCTTSVCVESTIRDAMFRDYSPILLEDCTGEPVGSGLPRSNHEASLFLIQLLA